MRRTCIQAGCRNRRIGAGSGAGVGETMKTNRRRTRFVAAGTLAASGLAVLVAVAPAQAVLSQNNLSLQGTLGRVRARPVLQSRQNPPPPPANTNTILQQGDPNSVATNPNRTVADDVIPMPFATAGLPLRILGSNPFAGDGHTHYHAGDTQILLNDTTGFEVGDTIAIGSPYCNFAFLETNCKRTFPATNEQPLGQVGHVAAINGGLITLATGLTGNPACFTALYGPCALVEGVRVAKLPVQYQGQQFRVDIPHVDVVNGSPNDVVVTVDFLPPQGSNNPAFPTRPLAISRDFPNDLDQGVDNGCGGVGPPPPGGCGAGFVSFYIPKEITGTATIGNTFSVDLGHTWYTLIVRARDAVTPSIVRADGVFRFKLNPVAITQFSPDNDPIFPGEVVNLRGRLRDNSSPAALASRPAEDVIVDVSVERPDTLESSYQTTSCVNTDHFQTAAADNCSTSPFGGPGNGHGAFQIRVGGLSFGSGLGGILTVLDNLEPGTYQATASLRGYNPLVTASTTYDVEIL